MNDEFKQFMLKIGNIWLNVIGRKNANGYSALIPNLNGTEGYYADYNKSGELTGVFPASYGSEDGWRDYPTWESAGKTKNDSIAAANQAKLLSKPIRAQLKKIGGKIIEI